MLVADSRKQGGKGARNTHRVILVTVVAHDALQALKVSDVAGVAPEDLGTGCQLVAHPVDGIHVLGPTLPEARHEPWVAGLVVHLQVTPQRSVVLLAKHGCLRSTCFIAWSQWLCMLTRGSNISDARRVRLRIKQH